MPSLDTMMSYHRLKRAPLDDMEAFNSLDDLIEYCETGACYSGQRVIVNDSNPFNTIVEYIIKGYVKNGNTRYIPVIDMRGSDYIFKSITFDGDSTETHGLLIYECDSDSIWTSNEVFTFNQDKLSIINQLELFNSNGFKFYIESLNKSTGILSTKTWSQFTNPCKHRYLNAPEYAMYATVTDAYFKIISNGNIKVYIMPKNETGTSACENKIIRIWVKAEDYYNALNS